MRNRLFFLLLFLLISARVMAQSHANEIGVETDNDSYLLQGSDRYYTDGIFLFFRHALEVKNPDKSSLANKVLGFEAGQKIYNPQSGSVFYTAPGQLYPADQPSLVDRPFAA